MLVGTLVYMSPEQAKGETIDGRTDVYSLGAVLYEMLSGQSPISGDTPAPILLRILTADVVPLGTLRPGLPLELEAIVHRAMRVDRAERFPDAGAMRAALDSIAPALADGGVIETGQIDRAGVAAIEQVGIGRPTKTAPLPAATPSAVAGAPPWPATHATPFVAPPAGGPASAAPVTGPFPPAGAALPRPAATPDATEPTVPVAQPARRGIPFAAIAGAGAVALLLAIVAIAGALRLYGGDGPRPTVVAAPPPLPAAPSTPPPSIQPPSTAPPTPPTPIVIEPGPSAQEPPADPFADMPPGCRELMEGDNSEAEDIARAFQCAAEYYERVGPPVVPEPVPPSSN
jgi:serine/threonine-protein kinase